MMQNISNLSWESVNSVRRYPLVDQATCVDDNGVVLPTEIINEVQLWVPDSLASKKIFISSISISNQLASVTFAIDNGGTFTPIGGCTVGPTINPFKNYTIKTYIDGAAGWLVFGNIAATYYGKLQSWVFSSFNQTGLLPKNVKTFKASGVTGITTKTANKILRKNVIFKSTNSDDFLIEYVPKTSSTARTIDGEKRDCIIFKLNELGKGADVYKKYLSACDVSPDSDTCLKPKIETINNAVPACSNGYITLKIVEELDADLGPTLSITTWPGMIRFDFSLSLNDVCVNSKLRLTDDKAIIKGCFDLCG